MSTLSATPVRAICLTGRHELEQGMETDQVMKNNGSRDIRHLHEQAKRNQDCTTIRIISQELIMATLPIAHDFDLEPGGPCRAGMMGAITAAGGNCLNATFSIVTLYESATDGEYPGVKHLAVAYAPRLESDISDLETTLCDPQLYRDGRIA